MIVKNKLDKPFGSAASSMGFFILIAGLSILYFSLGGVLLVLVGAFVGFTFTSAQINTATKQVRTVTHYFGIVPIGNWFSVSTSMTLGLKKVHRGHRAISRGNRKLDIHTNDFRVTLFGANKKPIIHLAKFNLLADAKAELRKLSSELGIGLV